MRADLGYVQEQHFKMQSINETLEQRIDQLKGQRDLSITLSRHGQDNELESQQREASKTAKAHQDLQ